MTPRDEDRDLLWVELCRRRAPALHRTASAIWLEGVGALELDLERAPTFEEVNARLEPLTGWRLEVADGMLPARDFLALLARRRFPAVEVLRPRDPAQTYELPDLFHDVMGHAVGLTDPDIAAFYEACGELGARTQDAPTRLEQLTRLFWYMAELGGVREGIGPRMFGATLISSSAHARHFRQGAERVDATLEAILAAPLEADALAPRLFVLDDLSELGELAAALGRRWGA